MNRKDKLAGGGGGGWRVICRFHLIVYQCDDYADCDKREVEHEREVARDRRQHAPDPAERGAHRHYNHLENRQDPGAFSVVGMDGYHRLRQHSQHSAAQAVKQ